MSVAVAVTVAVPVAYLAMLNLWMACRGIKWTDTTYHSLGMQQWTWALLVRVLLAYSSNSHKPSVPSLNCGRWHNKCNFTLLYLVIHYFTELCRYMVSQKDQGYAWIILLATFLGRVLVSMSNGIMGVLVVELVHCFDASSAEIIAASTTQAGIALCSCK